MIKIINFIFTWLFKDMYVAISAKYVGVNEDKIMSSFMSLDIFKYIHIRVRVGLERSFYVLCIVSPSI